MNRTRRLMLWMLWLNVVALVGTVVLWVAAWYMGWLESVSFVSHISLAALVLACISAVVSALGTILIDTNTPDA